MLYVMASHGYPLGLAPPIHEQSLCRAAKDYESFLLSPLTRKEIIRPCLHLKPSLWEEPLRAKDGLESRQFVKIDAAVQRPALFDIQDTRPNSLLFSFDSPYLDIRHEKFSQLHMSTLPEVNNGVIDLSLLSDIITVEALRNNMHLHCTALSLTQLDSELKSQKQLLDFFRDLGCSSRITVQRDGQVFFSCTETEMKDFVSFAAEYYLANSATTWRTQSVLIPHFDSSEVWVNMGQSSTLEVATVAPLERPEKVKRKQSNKRRNSQRATVERDLYRRNYSRACESLLSLMLNKSQSRKMAILALKKSGPEIPELLTQFSSGIAGTGLAVLFFVMCKVASGQVPLRTSNLISTGIGFGLMWLALAVNKLRDTILYMCKKASKVSYDDAEMARRVDRSIHEIFFRAGSLLVVALLRLA